MTNKDAVKALKQIKTYCDAELLDELDYAIQVIEKLEKDGISNPLTEDFTKLKKKHEENKMNGTIWSLVPAIVAIALALITKEVYSSLFIGIVIGGFFFAGPSLTGAADHIFQDGLIAQISDSYNAGILVF